MAAYFIQRKDQESGPFGFQELVVLVRQGELIDSDRVRFSWTNEWQRADSLVGLFHMARRPPEQLTPPEANFLRIGARPQFAAESIPAQQNEQDTAPHEVDRPGWVMRLVQVGRFRRQRPEGIPILGPAPATRVEAVPLPVSTVGSSDESMASSAPAAQNPDAEQPAEIAAFFNPGAAIESHRWVDAVEDVLSAVKTSPGGPATTRPGPFRRMFRGLAQIIPRTLMLTREEGHSLLRNGFRIVCAIACANLAAWSVENWSAQEALRFPSGDTQQAALRHFPFLGTCGFGEYLFLMFDLMLATGVAAWFAAGWLESQAE